MPKPGLCQQTMSTNQDQLLQALTPTIDGQPIRIADNHRHLGVILSSNLNWSSHACNMLQTAAKRAGLLRVMSNDLPLPIATGLYIYYVRPTMEYASAVWHGSFHEDIALSRERIQASVARRLLRADRFTPKETLLASMATCNSTSQQRPLHQGTSPCLGIFKININKKKKKTRYARLPE